MAQLFDDRCREARADGSWLRGTLRVAALWVLAVRDALAHGLAARSAAGGAVAFELRYALRSLRASPGFTLVALVTLTLGIGAGTALFSLLNAVVLRPLPVHQPERLVRVVSTVNDWDSFTNPMWEALRDREEIFDGLFAFNDAYFEIGDEPDPPRTVGAWVSGDFFRALGLAPAHGRLLTAAEDRRGCAPVVVLGHGFWQRQYGGGDVAGTPITVNGVTFEIAGVVDRGFNGLTIESVVDVYAPLCADALVRGDRSVLDAHGTWWLRVVGRLPAGVDVAAAGAALAAIAPAALADAVSPDWGPIRQQDFLSGEFLLTPGGNGFSDVREEYRQALIVLLAAVGVVILVVCVNLANLSLARAAQRRREIAMRVALGAGARRLLMQFLGESLMLAGTGAMAGVSLAYWLSRTLVAQVSPPEGVLPIDLSLDPVVLLFACGLSISTGVLFGVAPAAAALRVDSHDVIKQGGPGQGPAPSLLAGGTLVAAQVTLSVVLLTGTMLLVGTFWHLMTLDPGFDRHRVLLVDVDIQAEEPEPEQRRQSFIDLAERLSAIPGVRAASYAEMTPISGTSYVTENLVASGFESLLDEDAEVYVHRVGAAYFASLAAPVLRGRDIDAGDLAGAEPVAVLNESAARAIFGDVQVVGRTFHRRLSETEVSELFRVVGVVRDAKYLTLRDDNLPTVYFAYNQTPAYFTGSGMTFQVLPESGDASLGALIVATAETTAGGARVTTTPLAAHLGASLGRERLLASISLAFGALALFLTVIGLYGVMSFNVARRFHDIGVRLALGASKRGVFAHVLRQASTPVVAGLVLGMGGALAAGRTVESVLYGISPYDARALTLAAAVLGVAALLSAAIPARRAAGLDPAVVLRRDAT